MKIVHLLKVKWLWNICEKLDQADSYLISKIVPSLQQNIYGLNKAQVDLVESVYDKYKGRFKNNRSQGL